MDEEKIRNFEIRKEENIPLERITSETDFLENSFDFDYPKTLSTHKLGVN